MSMFEIHGDVTLAAAIEEVRRRAGESDLTEGMSIESARAFDMHDAVHIVFGCDESLVGEISAHVWMAFATTAPLGEMHKAVASNEHRKVLKGIGHRHLIGQWIALLPRVLTILWRAAQMRQRLPYAEIDKLKAMKLNDIRENYRILLM
jgi:ubiquinone biosynthesis protein Coq4